MKRESQNRKVWKHLESGKAITALGAINRYMILRLSARIRNLKDQGKEIYTKLVYNGNGNHAVYYTKNCKVWFSQYGKGDR